MRLRKIRMKDFNCMKEWTKDVNITDNFHFNPNDFSDEKIETFILTSFSKNNQHFAIVDSNDEYMGTISLKSIDYQDHTAEYAIVLRAECTGTGIGFQASEILFLYAEEILRLEKITLNVYKKNRRAIKLYEKLGFKKIEEKRDLELEFYEMDLRNLENISKYELILGEVDD